ncbi:hypothetical protein NL676_010252 [Syzygium grande]|nr:hypothetical protein NL676_010252 [Syzygium grande]
MRMVRNVGPAKSCYRSVIDSIMGLDLIVVSPGDLEFTETRVDFVRRVDWNATAALFARGAITWVSAQHSVQTPVAVVFE